ncbi:MAG: glycoside hydrolase family 97 catalytic domain-containing protein [Phaeodactylibacter sp.]|nr:glycoside hydrolase family 97 catalytic domain-containing protein [Phaeodactylibacter sp.]
MKEGRSFIPAAALLAALLSMLAAPNLVHSQISLQSPSGKLSIQLELEDSLRFALQAGEQTLFREATLAMAAGERQAGARPELVRQQVEYQEEQIGNHLGISRRLTVRYQRALFEFREGYSLEFRLFDNGVAYRFVTGWETDSLTIDDETLRIELPGEEKVEAIYSAALSLNGSYEELYQKKPVGQLPGDSLLYCPLLLAFPNGCKVGILDAGVVDYPAMYLQKRGRRSLIARFPRYPKTIVPGSWREYALYAVEREDYIARSPGQRAYPWRLFIVAREDKELLDNQLALALSSPPEPGADHSWVRPGKSTWDWWHDNSLAGLPFGAGMNTETYRHYIDFAARHGIEYITIDEGWSAVEGSVLDVVPEMDLPGLHQYAKSKGVGIFLWVAFRRLQGEMEEAMAQFREWGTAGLKVDFFERDDQLMLTQIEQLARQAAAHRLLLNLHGICKPFGLQRKYPNILNHEGVKGLENNKGFSRPTTPEYALQIPYIRMLAGYMDYTPGALRNRSPANFCSSPGQPMSMGTRCHQLAMYVLYFAPLQMLCDSPTEYEKSPETMAFLSAVPAVWDETIPLGGKVGEYALIARRKGEDWYVAAMAAGEARELEAGLSFLPGGRQYEATVWMDGPNARRFGEDFQISKQTVSPASKKALSLAPGGGAVMIISPVKK